MNNEAFTTLVKEEDLLFLEQTLEKEKKPFSLADMTERLVFHKTAHQREQPVLKYDPACRYEVGDLIYKEYDELLTIGAKQVELFQGGVVLKVIKKTYYPSYNCEILEVDYTGGGPFRKYFDYMKKRNSPVLLPSNTDGAAKIPERISQEDDPRQTQLPVTDRDLKAIERNLKKALVKSPLFFSWDDRWQLVANQVEIPEAKIKEIETYLNENKIAIPTEELVNRFFQVEPGHALFDLYCLCLNYVLEKKYKREFLFVSSLGWGKWHLKTILNSWLEGLPVSVTPAVVPPLTISQRPQLSSCSSFPFKTYLTWREIASGAIKIPRSLHKELGTSREFTFTDPEEGKSYTVYFYPQPGVFLGLKPYYQEYSIPQGTSLTLERKGPELFHFWIKKGKKRMATIKLTYDPSTDRFLDQGEEDSTLATPNKILYLERSTLNRLFSFYSQREGLDLHGLLVLIFKNFGEGQNVYSLHYLRAYHLIDMLKPTSPEEVELVLLNSPEFSSSEKGKGIFIYREPIAPAAEIIVLPPVEGSTPEIGFPPTEEVPTMAPSEVISAGQEEKAQEFLAEPITIAKPTPRIEIPPAPPVKEKPAKKQKLRVEAEKLPRARRSERKVIEERIELEESEQEALRAIKAKEEAPAEEVGVAAAPPGTHVEEVKPSVPSEKPAFSLFAEKLKSALQKKEKETEKK